MAVAAAAEPAAARLAPSVSQGSRHRGPAAVNGSFQPARPNDSTAGTGSASIWVTISSRLARSSSCCCPSATITEPATARATAFRRRVRHS